MKYPAFTLIAAALALSFALIGCSLDAGSKTKKYVIVDRGTGNTVSTYEYREGESRPMQIHAYGRDRNLKASYRLYYDEEGRLAENTIVKTSARGVPSSSILSYTYTDTYEAGGVLLQSVQKASNGEETSTFYGYDEVGKLRGVVQKSGSGLVMKDYTQ